MFADFFQTRCSWRFCNIHRKTPVLESLFNKAVGLQSCDFIKKRLRHRCFPVNIAKFLRTAFFIEHLWWLFLNFLQNLLKITVKKIITQWRFSQKFLRNHFLVSAATFLKITHFDVFHSFCFSLNISEVYLEPSQTSSWSLCENS